MAQLTFLFLATIAAIGCFQFAHGRAIPAEPVSVMLDPYGNPIVFLREKRTAVHPYNHRAMMFTGYYRPVKRSGNGSQATGVFAQGNAVSGEAFFGGMQAPGLANGPEPIEEQEISSAEAHAAPAEDAYVDEDGQQIYQQEEEQTVPLEHHPLEQQPTERPVKQLPVHRPSFAQQDPIAHVDVPAESPVETPLDSPVDGPVRAEPAEGPIGSPADAPIEGSFDAHVDGPVEQGQTAGERDQGEQNTEDQSQDAAPTQAEQEADPLPPLTAETPASIPAYTPEASVAPDTKPPTKSTTRPTKVHQVKKTRKPVIEEVEDDEDEDDDDDDEPLVPFVPFNKSNRRRVNYPNLNNFFPMVFSFPVGAATRQAGSSSPPGAVTAIANSYSTGKGGVASSVATAYGGSPNGKKKRPQAEE